jgi:hypothetical protein
MPLTTSPGEAYPILAKGPATQSVVPPTYLGLASSIAASGNAQSAVINSDGFQNLAVGITSSQAGSVSIQRFLDAAGTIAQGAPTTGTLVADTPLVVSVSDALIYQSFQITVTNSSASAAANLTNVIVVQQAT